MRRMEDAPSGSSGCPVQQLLTVSTSHYALSRAVDGFVCEAHGAAGGMLAGGSHLRRATYRPLIDESQGPAQPVTCDAP